MIGPLQENGHFKEMFGKIILIYASIYAFERFLFPPCCQSLFTDHTV